MRSDRQIAADCAALDRIHISAFIPPPCCGDCKRFELDAINPPAGVGTCQAGHGSFYPMQRKHCADFQPSIR